MQPERKPLVLLHGEVKSPPFSHEARKEAGEMLRRLQQGETLTLPHSRPMPSIGASCHELRIVDEDKSWRIIYRIDPDAILVAEVFRKTTAATPLHIINTCKLRFRVYDQHRPEGRMDESKRTRLEAAGYKVTDTQEFLGLSDEEMAYIDLRIALSNALRARRTTEGLTQQALATRLGSSQSRVAKMEARDESVSLDLLVRALLATGATVLDIAEAIAPERARAA